MGLTFQICEWQLMHTSVAGKPANADFSTECAIATIDSQAADVVLVAERHWLIANHIRFGHIRRAIDAIPGESCRGDEERAAENRGFEKVFVAG